MVSNIFRGDGGKKEITLPRDVKEAVSKCRSSVQNGLQQRISRMSVQMPVGAKFGVEKGSKSKREKEGAVTKETLETSDRELARIFVEMFQPLGGESISVVFNDADQAEKAESAWKVQSSAQSRVLSINRRSSKKKKAKLKSKSMGFAAKLDIALSTSSDGGSGSGPFKLPNPCELAIFVSPGTKELNTIHRLCRELGMDTLVILLNARLDTVQNFGSDDAENLFLQEFEPVFHLAAVTPQDAAPGCLLYRAFPSQWSLARKPKIGQPKVIASSVEKFSEDDCREKFEIAQAEISEFDEKFEDVLGNVANWFK